MLQLVKQITAAGAVIYLTNEHNDNWKYRSAVFMHGIHYDMGVAIIDCYCNCLYTACFGGSLEKAK